MSAFPVAGVDTVDTLPCRQAGASMTFDWTQSLFHILRYLGQFHLLTGLVGGGLVVAAKKWWQRKRQEQAAMWPSADAEVQAAFVKEEHGYWAIAEYRYYALQEYRYGKFRKHFVRKPAAEKFVSQIKGLHLQVRYREDNPDFSVLLENDLQMAGMLHTP
jgi:hypothetical protein